MKTTSQAVVIPIELKPHPQADNLSLVEYNGYVLCVRTECWIGKTRAIFIPPENFVDTRMEQFSFLRDQSKPVDLVKIKTKRLRGIISAGILIPCEEDRVIGQDCTEELGLIHDDPEAKFIGKQQVSPPHGYQFGKYDIDAVAKIINSSFTKECSWVVTLKVHGSNCRFLYSSKDEKFYAGSRTTWVNEDAMHFYPAKKYPSIIDFCRDNPDHTLYGELYGMQGGKYNYGLPPKNYEFKAFDIRKPDGTYLDYHDFVKYCTIYNIPMVPTDCIHDKFDLDFFKECSAATDTVCATTPREGVVVKPVIEQYTDTFERVIFKIIGPNYKG